MKYDSSSATSETDSGSGMPGDTEFEEVIEENIDALRHYAQQDGQASYLAKAVVEYYEGEDQSSESVMSVAT